MPKLVNYRASDAIPLATTPAVFQRRAVVGVLLVAFLAAFLLFAGDAWPIALHGLLGDGALALVWLAAAGGIGSLLPTRRNLLHNKSRSDEPGGVVPTDVMGTGATAPLRTASARETAVSAENGTPADALRRVSAVALGLGVMSLATLGLGLAGLLSRGTAWGLIAFGIVTLLVRTCRRFDRATLEANLNAALRADARHAWLWLPAVVTLALACAAAMALPGTLWNTVGDPHGYDVVEYHLQIPREWYEAGGITPLRHNVFSYFPFNVEVHYLLAMHLRGGPWAGMYLAQLMHVGFVGLAVLAVAAAARASGARPAAATTAGLAAASTPWMLLLAPVAYNAGGLLLFGTLAVAWAMLAVREAPGRSNASDGRPSSSSTATATPIPPRVGTLPTFALAGGFAGFACGTKLTGVPTVLLATSAVAFAVLLWRRVPVARALAGPTVFALAGLLTFSPWLIRNAVWAGNPVFPEAASVLGKAHFSDVQVERWKRAHAARPEQQSPAARGGAAWRELGIDWRYGWVILPAGVVLGAVRLRSARVETAVPLAMIAVMLVFWLAFTHLQSRFFVLAVPMAALLLARAPWRWWPAAGGVLFFAVSAATWGRTGSMPAGKIVSLGGPADLAVLAASGDESLAKRIASARRVTLVGDARAFWYPTPPHGLRYRTVFDVDRTSDRGAIEAWAGGSAVPADPDDLIIVDPAELTRFAKTYWQVPELPPTARSSEAPFVLPFR